MKLGEKIKFYREKRGYNLSSLAEKAGIAKSTLHKIEENKTNPTINTLWAIATILEIPFGELLAKESEIKEDEMSVVLIEKNDEIEVYKMTLINQVSYISQPHFNGITEQVQVLKGSILIGELENPKIINARDTLVFKADVPHIYKAMEDEVVLIVTIFYPKSYERYFYEDRFVKQFNKRFLESIQKELTNGLDSVRIIAKEIDFDFHKMQNSIQVIHNSHAIYIVNISKNYLHEIRKYITDRNMNILENLDKNEKFTYKLLRNEFSIIKQEPINYIDSKDFKLSLQKIANKSDFERRINVDLYSYFEYFHPGYTFQALLISAFMKQFPKQAILDIGSGPGNHLNLINEFTDKKFIFDCIEPSSKSLLYLKEIDNIKKIYNESFTKIDLPKQYELLLSVGSSHHMDLYEFLEKSYKLLKSGGYLIISDEFINKFNTKREREKALILHHTFYMLKVMFPLDRDGLSNQEKKLYTLMREHIPYARYLALNNEITLAKSILSRLFNQVKHFYIEIVENSLIAYYLFMILELEALVAGLDYEEECKTYSNNLIDIAKQIGFETILNFNFYPTYDNSGTHLIILKKIA